MYMYMYVYTGPITSTGVTCMKAMYIYIYTDPITSTVVTCMKARCPFYAAVYDTTGKTSIKALRRLY